MRLILAILALALLTVDTKAQFSGHRSETEIANMSPEQRAEEACKECARHGLRDSDYRDLLESYIGRDGLKAVPQLAKIISKYDPTRPEASNKENDARSDAAEGFIGCIDANVVRVRASNEGKAAIKAMRRLLERMLGAHFDAGESYDRRNRYEMVVNSLKEMEGTNACDRAIRDTLKLKYKVSLSDRALMDFVGQLISKDPRYPSWSERELYRDWSDVNEGGIPRPYVVLKNGEPFYKAYLEYKAKSTR